MIMQDIKIYTPVTGKTFAEFIDTLAKVQKLSDYIELRTDTIAALTTQRVHTLKQKTKKGTIFTCRKQSEGGSFSQDETTRRQLLQEAINVKFEYVDIELSTIEEHEYLRNKSVSIILSYHKFAHTRDYWDLTHIIDTMKSYHPDIVKIATMVEKDTDTAVLLKLLTNKLPNEKRIVIGMGERGKITRILGPLLGSYVTFATTPYSQSAPGQIELAKLQTLYKLIYEAI